MLKVDKSLHKGEKVVRDINRKVIDSLIDQLATRDLDEEQKQTLLEYIKNNLDRQDKKAENDSEFWHKYGYKEGQLIGMLKTAGIVVVSLTIAGMIKR